MQPLCRIFVLAAAVVMSPATANDGIYKWVDEDGVTHYSQQPPASGEAQLIDPESSSGAPEPAAEQASGDADDTDTAGQAGDADERELPGSVSEYCQEMRERVETLSGDATLQVRQDDGGLKELSSEERAERLERARNRIERHCGDE